MGIVRGRVMTPDWDPGERTVGEWPFVRCRCGKWIDPKTKIHAVTRSLKEMLELYKIDNGCPDDGRAALDEKEGGGCGK